MAYTRELVTELSDADYNRLYEEESVKEDLLSSLLQCEESDVKENFKFN